MPPFVHVTTWRRAARLPRRRCAAKAPAGRRFGARRGASQYFNETSEIAMSVAYFDWLTNDQAIF
jgi:hypothetical protein